MSDAIDPIVTPVTTTETPAAEPTTTASQSIEAEFLAAMAEIAPANDGEPVAEAPVVETPVVEAPKPPADDKLARRLALLAKEERRRKADTDKRAQEEARMKPDLDRLAAVRAAKTKLEAIKAMFGGDDEAVAEVFLELNDYMAGGNGKPVDPEKKLEDLVEERLEAKLQARDQAKEKRTQDALEAGRQQYVQELHRTLDIMADEFPLCSIAPPLSGDITAITEAMIEATGTVPDPEEVLKLIEEQRTEKLAKRRKPEKSTATAKSGDAAAGNKQSNNNPLRRNDAPVTPRPKLSLEEHFLQEMRALKQ